MITEPQQINHIHFISMLLIQERAWNRYSPRRRQQEFSLLFLLICLIVKKISSVQFSIFTPSILLNAFVFFQQKPFVHPFIILNDYINHRLSCPCAGDILPEKYEVTGENQNKRLSRMFHNQYGSRRRGNKSLCHRL